MMLATAIGLQRHFRFVSGGVGGVLHKIAGNGEVSVALAGLCHVGRIEETKP